ncbi:GNAT family N-acetyltransferase [Streptomyces zingiberis]|uniref:GNAT family N-acetyltransferase n=1 Tax=Streptomyces zingiberis TaxID=2053010 RepID=A0ABX1BUR8_9ACTN|nr:GNAT family N-acetyltransferase [Streptomyces zingiberis]NJP99496.1 GNAT family N-acetyltransferase [Streptomyces zingiberis]
MAIPTAIRTAVVPLPEVFGLRRDVLRPGLPERAAVFPEDARPDTYHLAAYESAGAAGAGAGAAGAVRACVTFFPEPFPPSLAAELPAAAAAAAASAAAAAGAGGAAGQVPAHRFRGMASDPAVRGRGFGRAVLTAGIAEARRRGAALVWCHARTGALGFYAREGFTAAGEEFEIEGVGPHLVLVRPVPPAR